MTSLDPILEALRYAADPPGNVPMTKLATVTAAGSTGVTVRFDGETAASARTYRTTVGVTVGKRVLMIRVGSTYVCAGSVDVADTGWITPTLSNGWATVSTTPAYRRVNGITHIRGTVTGGALTSTVFNLPVGFRPSAGLRVANWGSAAGHVSGIYVPTTGDVTPFWGAGSEHSFDGISFPADG